jgi:hypothetical protein
VDLPEDSPVLDLPWIITFGPMEDHETWEPVVCGPYERAHAMSLAENVVADTELLAVVEPVNPFATVEEIRAEIDQAVAAAEDADDLDEELEDEDEGDIDVSLEDDEDVPEVEPSEPPSPAEVRAGFGRIASRLAGGLSPVA